MAVLVALIGLAQRRTVSAMRDRSRSVRTGGGVILIVVGLWLLALAIWAEPFARFFPV